MGNNNYFFDAYKKNALKNKNNSEFKVDKFENDEIKHKKVTPFVFEKVATNNPSAVHIDEQTTIKNEKEQVTSEISKTRISAIFLILSGIEQSVKILKSFKDDELKKILKEILLINAISSEEIDMACSKFNIQKVQPILNFNGKEFVRNLFLNLYGVSDGSNQFVKIVEEVQKDETKYIDKLEPSQIREILSGESDLIVSRVLSFLTPVKAAGVIKLLPPTKAASIIRNMSLKSQINEELVKVIISKVNERAKDLLTKEEFVVKGKTRLLDIIKNSDYKNAERIIAAIEKDNPQLAEDLRENIFTFNDVLKIEKKDLELILKEYDNKDIAFILKGTSLEMKTFFLTCVTTRRKSIIENEIEMLGQVRKSDIEDKRKEFISFIKNMDTEGKIAINREKETFVE